MKKEKKERGPIRKWVPRILILYVIYFIAGALLPFAVHPEPSKKTQSDFRASDYIGTSSSNDRAYVVEENEEALDLRLSMFAQAEKEIILSTFDIRPGKSWDKIGAALLSAADRGVKVKILVDGMYGMLHMKSLPEFYAVGTHPNIQIKFYNPISLIRPWTVNGRLHDKYILVDDRMMLAGGRNTFDYFLLNKGKSVSYDREVFVYHESGDKEGNVFTQMKSYFNGVWNLEYSKLRYEKLPFFEKEKVNAQITSYKNAYAKASPAAIDFITLTTPVDKVSFMHNPTHIMNKEPVLFYQMTKLMMQAENRVFVQTPYASYSDYMYSQMAKVAAAVPQAELLINSAAVGDNIMASSDYLLHKEDIWATGFDTYEYFGTYSTHGKSVLIDNHLSIIGSFNFDMRSAYLDTETMIVIDGKEFQQQLSGNMDKMKADALKVRPDDGSYEKSDALEEKAISAKRLRIYKILGPIIQPIRFLV